MKRFRHDIGESFVRGLRTDLFAHCFLRLRLAVHAVICKCLVAAACGLWLLLLKVAVGAPGSPPPFFFFSYSPNERLSSECNEGTETCPAMQYKTRPLARLHLPCQSWKSAKWHHIESCNHGHRPRGFHRGIKTRQQSMVGTDLALAIAARTDRQTDRLKDSKTRGKEGQRSVWALFFPSQQALQRASRRCLLPRC